MEKISDALSRIFIQPLGADEDARRREYILNIILTASILILLMLDGLVFYHRFLPETGYLGAPFERFSALPLFFIFLYMLSRRRHPLAASYILIASLFVLNSYAAYTWGVDLPITLLAYAFIICIASILLGTGFGFAVAGLTSCMVASIWYLHMHGVLLPRRQHPGDDDIIVFSVFYFMIMTVSWLSNREVRKSLDRARRSESELKEERDLLEVRVEERTKALRRIQFEKVEQLHRFAEFGQLASGLFHDLLNLLNAISLRTEGYPAEEASLATAYATTRQIQRFMHAVQRQLGKKNFRESFSLTECVRQAIQLVAYKANKENVSITFCDGKERIAYFGVPFKFHQIIINLLINAIDAYDKVPKDGSKRREIDVCIRASASEIILSVSDEGCGISQAMQPKIFEPFFTTKEKSKGIGIGLASIKKIIEEDFHGTIAVKSAEHAGSTFVVTFPMNEAPR